MKLTKSKLKKIIKEELEVVISESDMGLEGYAVKYDSLRPGKPEGVPMWDQGGKPVAWKSKLHGDLVKRCADAGHKKCKEYLQNNISESIDVEKVENINSAIQAAYKQMMIPVKQDQVYADTDEPVSKDPKDMHEEAVKMIMNMVNDAISEVTPEELKGEPEEGFPSFMEWVEKNDPDLLKGSRGKKYPSLEIAKVAYEDKLRQYKIDRLEQHNIAKKGE
jgi:hypothetical protein